MGGSRQGKATLKRDHQTAHILQYVNKYSAAYWGTSFVREMGRLKPDEDQQRLRDAAVAQA